MAVFVAPEGVFDSRMSCVIPFAWIFRRLRSLENDDELVGWHSGENCASARSPPSKAAWDLNDPFTGLVSPNYTANLLLYRDPFLSVSTEK